MELRVLMHIVYIIYTVPGKESREETGVIGKDQPPFSRLHSFLLSLPGISGYTLKPTCFISLTGFLSGPEGNVINCNF